jgi:Flp pilus assembly protein TadG
MRLRTPGRRRPAVAAVELAFCLPIVLVPLMLGIWEVGRIVEVEQVLDNAAREGARQAATGKKTNAQVQQTVLQCVSGAGLNTAGATVTVTNVTSGLDAASANQLDSLKVSVTLPYDNVRWTSLNFFAGPGTTLNASAQWASMRDLPFTLSQTIPSTPQ